MKIKCHLYVFNLRERDNGSSEAFKLLYFALLYPKLSPIHGIIRVGESLE